MRILFTAVIASIIGAASLSAYAQTTAPATKAPACKGRAEANCQAPSCVWVAPTKTKAGKDVKGYCRKPPTKKSASATT